jgi:hypothetical protein
LEPNHVGWRLDTTSGLRHTVREPLERAGGCEFTGLSDERQQPGHGLPRIDGQDVGTADAKVRP